MRHYQQDAVTFSNIVMQTDNLTAVCYTT